MKKVNLLLLLSVLLLFTLVFSACQDREDTTSELSSSETDETSTVVHQTQETTSEETTVGESTTAETSVEVTTTAATTTEVTTTVPETSEPKPPASEGFIFKYEMGKDRYYISGMGSCTDTDIVFPTEYEGRPVYRVAHSVLKNNTTVKSVVIPEGYTGIGSFENCSSLEKIVIPSTVALIDSTELLFGCDSLKSIEIAEKNPTYVAKGNCIIEKKTGLLLAGCASSVIPDDGSVKAIGSAAFAYQAMTSLTVPSSVKIIYDYAFSGCKNLTELHFPEGITEVGKLILQDSAYALAEENWVNGVLYVGNYLVQAKEDLETLSVKAGTVLIADDVFRENTSLTEVTFNSELRVIGEYAFYWCSKIKTLILPQGLETIGESAFYYCRSVTEVWIPASVKTIEASAFSSLANEGVVIRCEEAAKPAGWDSRWVASKYAEQVVWGYTA